MPFGPKSQLNRLAWITTAVVSLLHFLPYLLLGNNAYVRVHDTLEGEWIWLHILKETHTAWDFDPQVVVPNVMNGLPRSAFPTGISLNMVMVYLFGTYWGYVINRALVHIIGFVSMYTLLRRHYIPGTERRYIVIFISLLFSLIPVYSAFGVSVMAQPLLLFCFINILKGEQKFRDFLFIFLVPFYSSIVWAAFPMLALLLVLGISDAIRNRRINFSYISAMGFLALMYVVINYPIFSLSYFSKEFIPHRDAYNLYMGGPPKLSDAINETLVYFNTNHYHIATFLTVPVFIAVLLAARSRYPENRPYRMLIFIAIICIFQGFYMYIEHYLGHQLRFLATFRMNRFSVLLPFLWLLAFGLSLSHFHKSDFYRPMILPFIFAQLIIILVGNDEILHNYRRLAGVQTFPVYRQYLAPDQFAEIRDYIGEPQENYRVVSLGLSPTIAQYNGFYTLDGLQSVYDLNYKKQFREVFAGELERNDLVRYYFDGWGNRCYMFSAELGKDYPAYMVSKFDHKVVHELRFNTEAFRRLGGQYLISAVEVENHDAVGLHFEKKFEHPESWWTIYLYRAEDLTPANP